jgi:hypothetical protein
MITSKEEDLFYENTIDITDDISDKDTSINLILPSIKRFEESNRILLQAEKTWSIKCEFNMSLSYFIKKFPNTISTYIVGDFIEYCYKYEDGTNKLLHNIMLQAKQHFPQWDHERQKVQNIDSENQRIKRIDKFTNLYNKLHLVIYNKDINDYLIDGTVLYKTEMVELLEAVDNKNDHCNWKINFEDNTQQLVFCLIAEPNRKGLRTERWNIVSFVECTIDSFVSKSHGGYDEAFEIHIEHSCTDPNAEGMGLSELLRSIMINMAYFYKYNESTIFKLDYITTYAIARGSQHLSNKLGFKSMPNINYKINSDSVSDKYTPFTNESNYNLYNFILSLDKSTQSYVDFIKSWQKYKMLLN